MKKIVIGITVITLLGSCFIFRKKERYGCPGSPQAGQLTNDQKIASGQKVKETKFKGGN